MLNFTTKNRLCLSNQEHPFLLFVSKKESIQYTRGLDEYTKEFEKLFLTAYLLMRRSQKKEFREWYNDKRT